MAMSLPPRLPARSRPAAPRRKEKTMETAVTMLALALLLMVVDRK
jgi:hypothetical protein